MLKKKNNNVTQKKKKNDKHVCAAALGYSVEVHLTAGEGKKKGESVLKIPIVLTRHENRTAGERKILLKHLRTQASDVF